MAEEKESIPIITHPGPTAEDLAKTSTTTTSSVGYTVDKPLQQLTPVDSPKPGTTRIAIVVVSVFVLILAAIVGKYVWKANVDTNYAALIATIVGAILGNLDRIFIYFFGGK